MKRKCSLSLRHPILLTVILFMGLSVVPQMSAAPRTIQVVGEAQKSVMTEYVEFFLTVETDATDLSKSHAANQAAVSRLVEVFKEMEIPEANYRLSNVSHGRTYEFRDGRRVPTGFYSRRNIRVELSEPKAYTQFISKISSIEAVSLNSVINRARDMDRLREEVRRMALENARSKAETMAQTLGMEITYPMSVSETGVSGPEPMRMASMAASDESSQPQIDFEDIRVREVISVTFEMEPR